MDEAMRTGNGDSTFGKDHFGDLEGATGNDLIFRAIRFTPTQLHADRAVTRVSESDGHSSVFPVLNISSSGVAIQVPRDEVVRNGQVLDRIEVFLDEVLVYSGRAQVINQRDEDDSTVVGLSFSDDYLGLGRLENVSKLMAALKSVHERLEKMQCVFSPDIPDWVKSLAGDFRVFLSELKNALDAAVPIGSPQEVETEVVKVVERQVAATFHEYIARMADLPSQIRAEHRDAVSRYMKIQLQKLLLPAPIYRQSLFKPLGYAGDYVTMNIAYTNHYQGDSAYAKFLNRMFCDLMISRAAIARVPFLTGWLARVIGEHPDRPVSVTSVASGPAREVQNFLSEADTGLRMKVTLFDQDPMALSFAQTALTPFARRFRENVSIRYVNGAVKHLVKSPDRFNILKNQDLVYTAGLFDYLRADVAALLFRNLYELLAPGGYLVVGNLTHECNSRGFLEYLVDWNIVYRSDHEILDFPRLVKPKSIWLESERTGVNRFLVVQR